MSRLTDQQVEQLLKPINPRRVLEDAKGHSHVSQQDVTAHLIRMFGFGGFDTEVLRAECVFERQTVKISRGKDKPDPNRYDVCYRALLRLTVKDVAGAVVATYEDGSTATAENQALGDAHDLAYKSAISLAKKRCAINLGDQFGLSLYNKGQRDALVMRTLVGAGNDGTGDVQEGVAQQVTLGNDEADYEPAAAPVLNDYSELSDLIAGATTKAELDAIGQRIATSDVTGNAREQLRVAYSARAKSVAA